LIREARENLDVEEALQQELHITQNKCKMMRKEIVEKEEKIHDMSVIDLNA